MQVTMDKVKTTAFVLKNRLMGYKLLQNPKGTNPNEVTMLKTGFNIVSDHADKSYTYKRIHRYKDGDKFFKDKIALITRYFIDPETKTYSGKRKSVEGYIENGKSNEVTSFVKSNVDTDEMAKRPSQFWHYSKLFGIPTEEFKFRRELYDKNRREEYTHYTPRPSLIERFFIKLNDQYEQATGSPITRRSYIPNFWQVLRTNLKGGGIAK